jgi:hypothetical protein
MTQEHQFLAELKDVIAVRLDCKCGASKMYNPFMPLVNIQAKCHQCQEEWMQEQGRERFMNLIAAMKALRHDDSDKFKLRFAFKND